VVCEENREILFGRGRVEASGHYFMIEIVLPGPGTRGPIVKKLHHYLLLSSTVQVMIRVRWKLIAVLAIVLGGLVSPLVE